MKLLRRTAVWAFMISLMACVGAAVGEDYDLDWWTVDGGGEMFSSGGAFELSGTIGQPDAGTSSGGAYALTGGFWFEQVCGDCNYDAGVDLLDFQYFPTCLSGPNGGLPGGCNCLDFDVDEDVDLADFAKFQAAFSGP